MTTVLPMAGMIARELSERLETEISFKLDTYAPDMVSRAQCGRQTRQGGRTDCDRA